MMQINDNQGHDAIQVHVYTRKKLTQPRTQQN